jgi:hypothetical protein
MTTVAQLPGEQLAGVDLQPLARVRTPLEDLAPRFGLAPERDVDALGSVSVVAVAVDGTRYLWRSFDEAPAPGAEAHCADAGDPVAQLHTLLSIVDFREEITHWWDGSVWHDDPLDSAA